MKAKGYSTIAGLEKLTPEEIKLRNLETYGSRIKAFRIRAGMSAEDLANALQISKSSVRNWECGLTRPDPEFLYRMFSILSVEPNEFFGIKGIGTFMDAKERSLLNVYRSLDQRGRMDLEAIADTLASQSWLRQLNRIYHRIDAVPDRDRFLSAGTVGEDWADHTGEKQILLYAGNTVRQADEVFTVSGASMEPQFYDGDKILVEYCSEIRNGDIGAFYVPGIGGIIKQKAYDRLHSLNPEFDDIFPYAEGALLIGRVLGKIEKDMIPAYEEQKVYREAEKEREKNPAAFDAFED